MNASHCSFLLFSLHPHVRDNYSERKFVVLSTTITAILTAFGIFANVSFILVMLCERIRRPGSDRLTNNPNIGTMARKRIIKNRNRSSNQIPKLLMISLAFNDLIYRLFISPLGVSDNMENGVWDYGWDACYARIFFIYYQFCVSICHINSMAIDRYIAVCKPLLYRLLTNKSGYLLIGCSWGFPAFMQLVPHVLDWAHVEGTKIFKCNGKECAEIYSTTSFIVLIVLGFCIPFFTPYCFYVFILKEVIMFNRRRPDFRGKNLQEIVKPVTRSVEEVHCGHIIMESEINDKSRTGLDEMFRPSMNVDLAVIDKIDETKSANHCNNNDVPPPMMKSTSTKWGTDKILNLNYKNSALRSEETNDASIQSRETNPTNRNMKAYRTVGAIILCFSLCWCPVWIILSQFFNARDPIPPWFNVLTNALSNMNPALNPLLYCLNRPVRQAIKSILCRSKCKIL